MADRRTQLLRRQVAWMVMTVLSLAALDALSYGLFVALSVLGLLVVTELSPVRTVVLPWRSRLRLLTTLGLLAVAAVALVRLDELLSIPILPW